MRFHNCLLFTLSQHKDEINTLSGHLLHRIFTHGTSKIDMEKHIFEEEKSVRNRSLEKFVFYWTF